ncbi:MAG: hypothetical protein E7H38_00625 [Varibaculum cambriense]|nr:hypothetical protein [Varibaculum cambriense]
MVRRVYKKKNKEARGEFTRALTRLNSPRAHWQLMPSRSISLHFIAIRR